MAAPYCTHFKFGYCRYRNMCRNQHIDIVCENSSCDVFNCNFRHPRECRYWKEFGRCKFDTYCAFKHVRKTDDQRTKCEIEELKSEIRELKRNLEEHRLALQSIKVHLQSANIKVLSTTSLSSTSSFSSSIPQNIPQLDGQMESGSPDFECSDCSKTFISQQDVDQHMEETTAVCDECGLCLMTEFENDIHEYEFHQEEYFKYNKLTPRSKQRAIQRLQAMEIK